MSGEKKHAPTGKRLKEARGEGNIPRSQDFAAWLGVAVCMTLIPAAISMVYGNLTTLLRSEIRRVAVSGDANIAIKVLGESFATAALALAPIGGAAMLVAIVATVSQGGMPLSTKAGKADFRRIDPISGFKRLFSKQTVWEAIKSLLKTAVVGVVVWLVIKKILVILVAGGIMSLETVLATVEGSIRELIRTIVAAGLIIAALDYVMARKRVMGQLKMTDQEVKDENKNTEGDPQIKGAIRSRQMAMSRNRMMAAVADADVVIVNPTHIAIGVKYDPMKGAPQVIAKGRGIIAGKIRQIATDNDVPLVEDVPLARALFYTCEVDQFIPVELYEAVAAVLAFLMRLRERGVHVGVHEAPPAATKIPEQLIERHPRIASPQ